MRYDVIERLRLNLRDDYYNIKSGFGLKQPSNLVVCNSFPKSGTHLLYEILKKFPDYLPWNDMVSVQSLSGVMNTESHIKFKIRSAPSNSIIRSHLSYTDELFEFIFRTLSSKMILITRDPRAIAASHANWVCKEPRIYLHDYYMSSLDNYDERLSASIKGVDIGASFGLNISNPSLDTDMIRWLPWLNKKEVLVVKFEDLVGDRGGMCEVTRLKTIKKIAKYLKITTSIDQETFGSLEMDPSKSHTFNKGMSGQANGWRKKYSDKNKFLFEKICPDLSEKFGYSNSFDEHKD